MIQVSIHIHPEGRMKPEMGYRSDGKRDVSIHIHPEGRMKRRMGDGMPAEATAVSIHIHPEGRMKHQIGSQIRGCVHRFNPHPPRRADETVSHRIASSALI